MPSAMRVADAVALLDESGLSPEGVAERLSISNSTYRRWRRARSGAALQETYRANVASAVHKLLAERLLSHDSPRVGAFLRDNLPDFFHAALAGMHVTPGELHGALPQQDRVAAMLSHLGNSRAIRNQVDGSAAAIGKFARWGNAWKAHINGLSQVIKSKRITLVDKLVAYGALFYLIFPFDLIPDALPGFGYVDDFGILAVASAFYGRAFPAQPKSAKAKG